MTTGAAPLGVKGPARGSANTMYPDLTYLLSWVRTGGSQPARDVKDLPASSAWHPEYIGVTPIGDRGVGNSAMVISGSAS